MTLKEKAEQGFDSRVEIAVMGADAEFYICTNVFAVDLGVRGVRFA